MRIIFVLYLLCFCFQVKAQHKVIGQYNDWFAGSIDLYSDSTFMYRWSFDLQSSWTKGTWRASNDTIYFTMVPVYDTIKYDDNNNVIDLLTLSVDEKPEQITRWQSSTYFTYGQNIQPYPKAVFYRKDKLFRIYDNGKLIKAKTKGFETKKRYGSWYTKQSKSS